MGGSDLVANRPGVILTVRVCCSLTQCKGGDTKFIPLCALLSDVKTLVKLE